MKSFPYVWKAIDLEGRTLRGVSELEEIGQIRSRLREQGFYPVLIRPGRNPCGLLKSMNRTKYQWVSTARHLATLLEAGIPLLSAVEILTVEGMTKHKQEEWQRVKEKIESGSELSEALTFLSPPPTLYISSMVKAGEQTGRLAQSLHEVADELDQEYFFRNKIQGALAYPLLLLAAGLSILHILGIWVLPMYEKLFAGLDAELPYLTRVIFAFGRHLPLFVWGLLFAVCLVFLGLWFKNPGSWKLQLQRFAARLPLIGSFYRLADLVQFSRILGGLLQAGIPLLDSLYLTADTVRSQEMRLLISRLIRGVREGKRLAPVLRTAGLFPLTACQMVLVGEESGRLDVMFQHVARTYRRELEQKLERFSRMIEPAFISGMALFIGLVAVGVLLPVFEASTHLQ